MVKKNIFWILVIVFIFTPVDFVYGVVNTMKGNESIVSKVSISDNEKYIYLADKINSIPSYNVTSNDYFLKRDVGNTSFLAFRNFKVIKDKKGNKKKDLLDFEKSTKYDFSNVANIVIPKIGYYYDADDIKRDNEGRVWVDLKIDVASVHIEFFESNDGKVLSKKCNTRKYYKISSFVASKKKFTSSIMRYSNLDELIANTFDKSKLPGCDINTEITYNFTFIKNVDKSSIASANPVYIWKIMDLDQPDDTVHNKIIDGKKKFNKDGKYIESINFVEGFSDNFYVYEGTKLTNNGSTKFSGTVCVDSDREDCENDAKVATVYAVQKGDSVSVVWRGSRDLGTSLFGEGVNFPPPLVPPPVDDKYNYKGDKCDVDSNATEVACGKEVSIKDNPEHIGNVVFKNHTADVTKHSSCKEHSKSDIGTLYQKIGGTDKVTLVDNNNDTTDISNRCVKVNVNVDVLMIESLNFKMGNLGASHIYAGGGFSWNGASATSEVTWVPSIKRSTVPGGSEYETMFVINYDDKYKLGDKSFVDSSEETASSVELYSKSDCSGERVSDKDINDLIGNYVKNKVSNSSHNFGIEASSNYNEVTDGEDDLPLIVVNNNNKIDLHVETSVNLQHAYINRTSALIKYVADNDEKISETEYLDAGDKYYYVPLKYTESSFSIWVNSSVSAIGQSTRVSSVCSLSVGLGLYEKKNEKYSLRYRYRPINVNNPFPKADTKEKIARTAENWADWYCGESDSCSGVNSNKNRLSNTYNYEKPLYSIILNSDSNKVIDSFNKKYVSYIKLDEINTDEGSSSLLDKIIDKDNSRVTKNSYCGLGIFKESCDTLY